MTLANKIHLGAYITIMALVGLFVIYVVSQKRSYEKQLNHLQNVAAEKDKTIELKDGLYHKLAVTTENLQGFLTANDKYQKQLTDELRKSKQDLLTSGNVIVGLKKELVELKGATQTTVPGVDGKPERVKVDFHDDFGVVKVDGWTMTNPPQSWVRLSPGNPLQLSVSIAQAEDKSWHSYVTVNDDRFGVDIKVAAVNPYVLKPKWYEGIGIVTGLGVGTNQSGLGALLQVGLSYKLRQFTFGPSAWFGMNNTIDKYYGVIFEWRPFEKNR